MNYDNLNHPRALCYGASKAESLKRTLCATHLGPIFGKALCSRVQIYCRESTIAWDFGDFVWIMLTLLNEFSSHNMRKLQSTGKELLFMLYTVLGENKVSFCKWYRNSSSTKYTFVSYVNLPVYPLVPYAVSLISSTSPGSDYQKRRNHTTNAVQLTGLATWMQMENLLILIDSANKSVPLPSQRSLNNTLINRKLFFLIIMICYYYRFLNESVSPLQDFRKYWIRICWKQFISKPNTFELKPYILILVNKVCSFYSFLS